MGSGSLCWSEGVAVGESGDAPADSAHTLNIDDIQEISLGKSADAFLHSDQRVVASADSSRCFSLSGGAGRVLCLEAASSESINFWLCNLNAFLATGRKVVELESASVDDVPAPVSAEEELAAAALADVEAGDHELSEEERRELMENNSRRRFSVQNTAAATGALPEIVEADDEEDAQDGAEDDDE
jgi:hypothetical protein